MHMLKEALTEAEEVLMEEAALMAGEEAPMVGVVLMEVTGMEVSGLALDGVGDGVDGVRGGGVPRTTRTIPTIRTMPHPL